MDPRASTRLMVVAVMLVAFGVTSVSLQQAPIYEASAWVRASQKPGEQLVQVIDSRSVAEEVIQRLELDASPAEPLDNLTVEQVENTSFIVLTYADTDTYRATQIVNTASKVASEYISATVLEKAEVSYDPVGPHPLRNGLLTLAIGLVLCAALRLPLFTKVRRSG